MKPTDETGIKKAIVTIKVFGVGGGGNMALLRMAESNFSDIELIAVNTDASQLARVGEAGVRTLQIGQDFTKGRGTGGNPSFGEAAAKNDENRLREAMSGADLIFITAAMGGGVGTGASPVIARIAKEQGILSVGVVTLPFAFEGQRKRKTAMSGVVKMQSQMDALIAIQNDNLLKLPDNRSMSMKDAFVEADNILKQAVRCVAELILTTGIVNVDFADVTTIFRQSESSDAILGIGVSERNAADAVRQAVASPLIDKSLEGARGIILNITASEALPLYDVNEATQYIYDQADKSANIIFGAVIDNKMGDSVQATIIATDFSGSMALKAPSPETPKTAETVGQGFTLETPTFMVKSPPGNASSEAFALPAFKITENDNG